MTILWGAHTFLRKTRGTHHINVSTIGNLHLKSGYTLQKRPRQGVTNIPCWHQSHFMQTIRLYIVVGTHTKGMKHNNIVRCIHFSQLNNMHPWQHQYISTTGNLHLKSGPTLQKPPWVCKEHYTCSNQAKWKVRGQLASTDHPCYWPRFHWQSRCAWGAKKIIIKKAQPVSS